MPAAGTASKLPPSPDCAQLPSPSVRHRPSATTGRHEPSSPPDHTALPLDRTVLPPGAALAGFAEAAQAAGLSRLTDDELAGVIRAGRRLSSWASALELAAVGDLMRRREQQEAAGYSHAAEHADAEIAALLTLTGRGAG